MTKALPKDEKEKRAGIRKQATIVANKLGLDRTLVANALLSRSNLLAKLTDPRRDLYAECGYPTNLLPEQYRQNYDRSAIARRVVNVLPEESWANDPWVYETEDNDSTPFEEEWNKVAEKRNVFHYLHRVDEISGIGRFGVLLMGFDDGLPMDQPVAGVNLVTGERDASTGSEEVKRELLFLRTFDESVVQIHAREQNEQSPRYGQPLLYRIEFRDVEGFVGTDASKVTTQTKIVHWTRVIHVADNRVDSEVLGTPRQQVVFNRLYDNEKVAGGSAEMFWKGAFPGLAFEINPQAGEATLDSTSLREELANYANGLQRYLSLVGVSAKSLSPQVADPSKHVEVILTEICIALGVPKRVFMGSEEAKLASTQDTKTWARRLNRRQDKYIGPMILRPFVDRLIAVGVLPAPAEENGFTIHWEDLNASTDQEKAAVGLVRTQALAAYVAGDVAQVVPPEQFLTQVLEMDPEVVTTILEAAEEFQGLPNDDQEGAAGGTPGKPGEAQGKPRKGSSKPSVDPAQDTETPVRGK